MFVDKSRGISVVMGEKDNKQAMDKRRKNLIKEKLKYGKAGIEEEVELKWDHYYTKVDIFKKLCFSTQLFLGQALSCSAKHWGWDKSDKSGPVRSHERQD